MGILCTSRSRGDVNKQAHQAGSVSRGEAIGLDKETEEQVRS